jgi:response regulator RpfG family c-di-GMP phosphodiesterase
MSDPTASAAGLAVAEPPATPMLASSTPPSSAAIEGRARILVVDDEETIRLALSRFLRSRSYEVHTAVSGAAALDALARGKFTLMVCDVRMPGMTGVDVVPHALAIDPDLAVMILSAVNDAGTATEALSRGATDYLMKPVELADLQQAVERALHRRSLTLQQRAVERVIREEVATRTADLEREQLALHHLMVVITETLVNAMEAKDVFLRGHSQRVAEMAATIAAELGLDEETIENVRLAGRLHDVGKIGIRESVLNKPDALTAEEFAHVQDHVRIGMEILAPLRHVGTALTYVRDHHEHWDGGGYPSGLGGADISIGGRILCAADAYDAATSPRAYREALTPEAAIAHLGTLAGQLIDPTVYAALRAVILRRKTLVFLE